MNTKYRVVPSEEQRQHLEELALSGKVWPRQLCVTVLAIISQDYHASLAFDHHHYSGRQVIG